ncbi:MAG: GNAT family N-acetyltransferase [Alphaproteobacteria bacterium]|nr:GNAT family N-acetyltransferase [Alphaproteobacteria bacterium]
MEPVLTVTDAPGEAAMAAIQSGLAAFNDAATGIVDRKPLAVLVSDPRTGEVVGGVLGRTSLGLMFVDLVYLPDELRGGGVGRRMIAMAEEEGRRRGCAHVMLYTITFQAPGFYAKLGYREFGRIPCDPPGTARVFMTKALR